jgi:hypothetical protein
MVLHDRSGGWAEIHHLRACRIEASRHVGTSLARLAANRSESTRLEDQSVRDLAPARHPRWNRPESPEPDAVHRGDAVGHRVTPSHRTSAAVPERRYVGLSADGVRSS